MRHRVRAALGAALLGALGLLSAAPAWATRYCDAQGRLNADQKDKIFRFGAVIKEALEASGAPLALVARSGLDLSRFKIRYSHAGISLKASPDTPWAVRQLYFACDEGKPLIFDQGMSAFLMGTDEPGLGYVSLLLLPAPEAAQLERAALDNRQALQLLGADYSANAYPFSELYQNCNQWVMELLAAAFGGAGTRAQAQQWLRAQDYAPTVIDVGALIWLSFFVPWVHNSDHPAEDRAQAVYRVSMPASIEAFVQQRLPGARRLEFCHNSRHVVVREGWTPIAEGCEPAPGDRVLALD
jgi:hypothetical protein